MLCIIKCCGVSGTLEVVSEQALKLRISSVESVAGEAFVNNRKNKLIPSYELEVKGSWQGSGPQEWVVIHLRDCFSTL